MRAPTNEDLTNYLKQARAIGVRARDALLGTRRRQVVSASVAAALVIGLVGAGVGISYANEQQAIAEAHAADVAAAKAEALADARAKAAEERRAQEALAAAKSYAIAISAEAVKAAEDSNDFADPAVLKELEAARIEALKVAEGTETGMIDSAGRAVKTAIDKIGTRGDAQDRKYLALAVPEGDASDPEYALKSAHETCDELTQYNEGDIQGAAFTIVDESHFDVAAVTIFCPEFKPAVDLASRMIPEGKYAVKAEATPIGSLGRDVAAGTYVIPKASDCYWSRTASDGEILDNDFIGFAPGEVSVTLFEGEGFETNGCAVWVKQ